MLINTSTLASLFQAYNAAFQDAFKTAETEWAKISTMIPSATESNLYAFLGQFPKLREWIGDRVIKDMATSDYTLTNKSFESTVGVPKEKIEDDTFGVFTPLFAEMGYAAKLHPDELIFPKLAAGATDLCYDGQAFFSASHPVVVDEVATTASNYDSTSVGELWVLMDTRRPLKPMIWQKRKDYNFESFTSTSDEHVFMRNEYVYGVDGRSAAGYGLWQLAYGSINTLNATNFDAAWTAMTSLKSDEGKPLGIMPNLLVCGSSNRTAARDLIEMQTLVGGAGEANPHYKAVEVLVTPQLA